LKIDVRFDSKKALVELSAYGRKLHDRAMVRALNRTATTVRAVAARLIAPEVKPIKIAEVKRAIKIKKAERIRMVAIVRAGGRRNLSLPQLGAMQTKTGVRVRVGGKVYNIAHAFINKVRKSREGVRIRAPDFRAQMVGAERFRAKRTGRGYARKGGHSRAAGFTIGDYPIAEIFAPGIPTWFVQDRIMAAMKRSAVERFRTVIEQEVKFLASKG